MSEVSNFCLHSLISRIRFPVLHCNKFKKNKKIHSGLENLYQYSIRKKKVEECDNAEKRVRAFKYHFLEYIIYLVNH